MPKIISLIAAALLFFLAGTLAAAETPDFDYGRERIEDALPDEAADILDEQGLTPDNGGAAALTLGGVLDTLWETVKSLPVFTALADGVTGLLNT
ncbi:MAG: hypothetical protein ACI4XA_10875 [Oscillospiraceae bacterium]